MVIESPRVAALQHNGFDAIAHRACGEPVPHTRADEIGLQARGRCSPNQLKSVPRRR
jgi:hypothetical protein